MSVGRKDKVGTKEGRKRKTKEGMNEGRKQEYAKRRKEHPVQQKESYSIADYVCHWIRSTYLVINGIGIGTVSIWFAIPCGRRPLGSVRMSRSFFSAMM